MNKITHLRRNNFILSIHVDGKPVPFYMRADGTPFIEGIPGKSYEIHTENIANGRLEILASVDGRNTLKQEEADWRSSTGMIVNSGLTWRNKGWRLDDEHIAEFQFSDPESAVASAAGAPKSIGVIGFAIFKEKRAYRSTNDSMMKGLRSRGAGGSGLLGGSGDLEASYSSRGVEPISERTGGGLKGMGVNSSHDGATMDWMEMDRERSISTADVGTGAGETKFDKVGHTEWTRDTHSPIELVEIQYRTRATLERMGLIHDNDPHAFTVGADDTGYKQLLGR